MAKKRLVCQKCGHETFTSTPHSKWEWICEKCGGFYHIPWERCGCPCGGKLVSRHLTAGRHNILAVCPDCDRQYRLVYVPDERDISEIPQELLREYEVRG